MSTPVLDTITEIIDRALSAEYILLSVGLSESAFDALREECDLVVSVDDGSYSIFGLEIDIDYGR